jgi:hypothetical protein
METRPLLGLMSGYIRRGLDLFPKQGPKAPWMLPQNYVIDLLNLRFGKVDDGTLAFSKGGTPMPNGVGGEPAPLEKVGTNGTSIGPSLGARSLQSEAVE